MAADGAAVAGAAEGWEVSAAERELLQDVPVIRLYFYVAKRVVAPRVEG